MGQQYAYAGQDISREVRRGLAVVSGKPFVVVERDDFGTYAFYELSQTPRHEIALLGTNQKVILSGDEPDTERGADFGRVINGTVVQRTFRVQNWGSANLTLTGAPFVQIVNNPSGAFTISQQPASATITPFQKANFVIHYVHSGTEIEDITATVRVLSNDATEPIYEFDLKVTALPLTGVKHWALYEG